MAGMNFIDFWKQWSQTAFGRMKHVYLQQLEPVRQGAADHIIPWENIKLCKLPSGNRLVSPSCIS